MFKVDWAYFENKELFIVNKKSNFYLKSVIKEDLKTILNIARNFMDEILQISWKGNFEWDKWEEDLEQAFEDKNQYLLKIITTDNNLIGFLWLDDGGKALWLTSIIIIPEFQRQGLGTQILLLVEEFAILNHFRKITLGVQHINLDAIKFYKKLNYLAKKEVSYAGTTIYEKRLKKEKEKITEQKSDLQYY